MITTLNSPNSLRSMGTSNTILLENMENKFMITFKSMEASCTFICKKWNSSQSRRCGLNFTLFFSGRQIQELYRVCTASNGAHRIFHRSINSKVSILQNSRSFADETVREKFPAFELYWRTLSGFSNEKGISRNHQEKVRRSRMSKSFLKYLHTGI